MGLIFTILGIGLIVASYYIRRQYLANFLDPATRGNRAILMVSRIMIVIILLIAIPFCVSLNISKITASVKKYNDITKKASITKIDTNRTIGIVLNAEKFMNMMKPQTE